MKISKRCSLLNRHKKKYVHNWDLTFLKTFTCKGEDKKNFDKGSERFQSTKKSLNKTLNIQLGKSIYIRNDDVYHKSRNASSHINSNYSPLVSLTNASFSILENDKLKSKIDTLSNINDYSYSQLGILNI